MSDAPRLQHSPTVLARSVGERVILTAGDREGFEVLDGAGAMIWDLLEEAVTPGEITATLAAWFEGPRDVIAQDVEGLLADLRQRGLIEEVDASRG
ncbi:MAG TPA: PqqD family protein [Actinomycetota bacterium]